MLPPASCRVGGRHQKGLLNILIGHKKPSEYINPQDPISTLYIGPFPWVLFCAHQSWQSQEGLELDAVGQPAQADEPQRTSLLSRFLLDSWTFPKISEKETHFARNVVLGRSVCLLVKGSRKAFIPQILKVLGFKKCLHSGKFAFAKAFRKSNLTLNSTKSFLQLVAFTTYHKE